MAQRSRDPAHNCGYVKTAVVALVKTASYPSSGLMRSDRNNLLPLVK